MKTNLEGESVTQPDAEWTEEQKEMFYHLVRSMGWPEKVGTPILEGRIVIDFAITQKDLLHYCSSYQVFGRQSQ